MTKSEENAKMGEILSRIRVLNKAYAEGRMYEKAIYFEKIYWQVLAMFMLAGYQEQPQEVEVCKRRRR